LTRATHGWGRGRFVVRNLPFALGSNAKSTIDVLINGKCRSGCLQAPFRAL
jgi:hypothetical protein